PLSPLLGGVGLALSAHSLLVLNGRIFGISGFLHRAVKGSEESILSVAGLVLGGFIAGQLEGAAPPVTGHGLDRTILAGLLVGLGTKLANGCTSGHMLCGLSRLSVRSLAATVTFFTTGAVTTRVLYGSQPYASSVAEYTYLSRTDALLLAGSAFALALSWMAPMLWPVRCWPTIRICSSYCAPLSPRRSPKMRQKSWKFIFFTAISFALSLRVSKLVDPYRVIKFLLLPSHPAFDPALLSLATGAIPLLMAQYRLSQVKINIVGLVDAKLLIGAALFGIGWGIEGICPGPGLVNLGQALATGTEVRKFGAWLAAVIIGGLI
ncbi:hypothetical protein K488DRAFT_11651, partial [Vararia minispora EC-137]